LYPFTARCARGAENAEETVSFALDDFFIFLSSLSKNRGKPPPKRLRNDARAGAVRALNPARRGVLSLSRSGWILFAAV